MSQARLTWPQLALRSAEPWLQLAATAMDAAQRAHYPLPARALLAAIPANVAPPRQPPSDDEPVRELCERIPVTAERLRCAAFTFAAQRRWSPAAISASWRRVALASAITSHGGEFILRTLAERASQLGLEPAFGGQLDDAAEDMQRAWKAWRAVTNDWDIVTTGTSRGAGLTPVAREIDDLVVRTGRLAYRNPHWTPACRDASLIRDPADLARSPDDVVTVLAAVHHAADAISMTAAKDHEAVCEAAAASRLYIPVRLLPDTYDIPHPYTPAPREHADALLATYDTAVRAAARAAIALDDLAAEVDAPSSVLAAARQVSTSRHEPRSQRQQRPAPRPAAVTPVPGRTEQALRKLLIRDPALLLRAAVIDQTAHDLVAEATAKARCRDTVTVTASRPIPAAGRARSLPARVASQDAPLTPQSAQLDHHQRGAAAAAAPAPPASGQHRNSRAAPAPPPSLARSRPR